MLTINKASSKDSDTISELGKTTFTQTFGHLFRDPNDLSNYLNQTFSKEKIHGSLSKSRNHFWIAYWNNKPVGYAKLKLNSASPFIKEESSCQLQKIYVLKEYLSKKIGHALQSELLDEAKKLQYKSIWLSVLRENERAIQFYTKHNFSIVGEHDFQIGKENFTFKVMSMHLSDFNKPKNFICRKVDLNDLDQVLDVFNLAIRNTASKDYTAAQIKAWSASSLETDRWTQKILNQEVYAVVDNEKIIGFSSLEHQNYMDLMYVHPSHTGKGIAKSLCNIIEELARNHGTKVLHTDASETAKPFFERMGFSSIRKNSFELRGVLIHNYHMEKKLF
ncbi:MAG: hypothetical protein CMB99_11610 [Flavobacteriaceae bacterium]|nr:hypothetical protein [Flavobacteriaceae bacterium]|tara:strand:- start:239695 stop:240696 length:1002 start_codon:yes stop_codon:yes gene_type:complete